MNSALHEKKTVCVVLPWEPSSLNRVYLYQVNKTPLTVYTRKLWYKLDPTLYMYIQLRQKRKRNEIWKYFQLTWTTLKFLLWSKPTWLVFLDRQAPNTEGQVEQPWKCASPERSVPGPQSKRWSQNRNTPGWPCLSCCCQQKDDEKCVLHVFFRQYVAKEVLDNTAVKLLLFQFDTTHKHNVAMTKYTVQISDTTNYSSSFHHTQTFLWFAPIKG